MKWVASTAMGLVFALVCLMPGIARADAGLQLNPLRYDDVLAGSTVKNGFIDVSNPSDTSVVIRTSVRGFKQADLAGNLSFFEDDILKAGIRPSLTEFSLGPRESLRLVFSVDPNKLPQGGVYAAIFFTTVPPPGKSSATYITETANVGTLLLLQNGDKNVKVGQISRFDLPLLQLGSGLSGTVQFQNTNRSTGGIAFSPVLTSSVWLWGKRPKFTGSFVMPQSTREFSYRRAGSYLGLMPVTLSAAEGNSNVTRWVLACTGWYQWLVLILFLAIVIFFSLNHFHHPRSRKQYLSGYLNSFKKLAAKLLRRNGKPAAKRSLDGMSRKSDSK